MSHIVRLLLLLLSEQAEDSDAATDREAGKEGWNGIATAEIRLMSRIITAARSPLEGDGMREGVDLDDHPLLII